MGFREQAIIDLVLISGQGALDPFQDRMTVVGCVLMRDETDSQQAALLFSDHVSFRNTPTTDFFFLIPGQRNPNKFITEKRGLGTEQPLVLAALDLGVKGSKASSIGPFCFISGIPLSLVIEPTLRGQSSCHSYAMSVITEKCFMSYYTDRTTTARLARFPQHHN